MIAKVDFRRKIKDGSDRPTCKKDDEDPVNKLEHIAADGNTPVILAGIGTANTVLDIIQAN